LFIYTICLSFPMFAYIEYFSVNMSTSSVNLVKLLSFGIVWFVISLFVGNLVSAFYYSNASKYFLRQKYEKLSKSFENAKKRYWHLLGTQILLFLILFGVFFLFGGFAIFSYESAISILGITTGLVALIITLFLLMVSPAACVIGKLGPVDSIKESYSLIMRNKLNTFAFLIIFFIITYIINLVGTLPLTAYSHMLRGESLLNYSIKIFPFFLFQSIFGVIAAMFDISAIANFYITLKKGKSKKKRRKTKKKK
ncbi:MAG: hypothetical protein J7K87_04420, partial [Candidatus Aenigmarchaeota archaeon]|nr:hypothetical protein [Candidatus Aenigmarchaeota archaeon]